MIQALNLYGEPIQGTVIREHANVVTVRCQDGNTHVVHKKMLDSEFNPKPTANQTLGYKINTKPREQPDASGAFRNWARKGIV